MKKRIVSLLIPGLMIMSLTACGTAGGAASSSGTTDTAEADTATENTESGSAGDGISEASDAAASSSPDYIYEKEEDFEGEDVPGASYTHTYSIYDGDDGAAVLKEEYIYSDSSKCEYTYSGSLEKDDTGITFVHKSGSSTDTDFSYFFPMLDGEITGAEYMYDNEEVASITGSYTCQDEDGLLTLDVDKAGNAVLTNEKGESHSGSIVYINDRYDLMIYDDSADLSIDWYIYLNDGTFTHENYYDPSYENADGTYICEGDLGELTVDVATDGSAVTTVNIDGNDIVMSGYIYMDESGESPASMYLSSDDGYSLDLTIESIESDGTYIWNYSGYITRPLSAG